MAPPLFSFTLFPIVSELRVKYDPLGVRINAHMDDINVHLKEITAEAVQVLPDLVDELEAVGIVVNKRKSSALPPPGHEVALTERRLFHDVDLPIVKDSITVVGVPTGTDACVEECAVKKINRSRRGQACTYVCWRVCQTSKWLISSRHSHSPKGRSGYIEGSIDHKRARKVLDQLDNGVMWVLESSIGLRETKDEEDFFQEDQQGLLPRRPTTSRFQPQALTTSAGAPSAGAPIDRGW